MLVLPLSILWFPAVALALLDGRKQWVGWVAVVALSASFAAQLWLAATLSEVESLEMVAGGWPAGVGIVLRLDMMGVLFALLSTGVLWASLTYELLLGVRSRTFPALILFMAVGLVGLFSTGDAFNFYVFFEVAMTSAFVLTGYGEQPRQIRADLIFVVVNLIGSVLFLSAVAGLYHVTGTLEMQGIAAQVGTVHPNAVILIAALLFSAFGLKLGLFPFHFWLPTVYRDSSPAVAAMLSGALANIGSYGLLRFGGQLLPEALQLGAPVLLILGAASLLYGEILAVSRYPASEVLAYSTIGQVGYIMIALAIGGSVGYSAAVLYVVVNALNKTLLFLSAGLRGRLVGAAFAVGAFSVAGIPPSAGFLGKVAMFQAGIQEESAPLVALVFVGGALSLVYMFQIYQRVFWRPGRQGRASPLSIRLLALALAVLIVALGLWPEPLLSSSRQAGAMLAGTSP